MQNIDSYFYFIMPGLQPIAIPVSKVKEYCKTQSICLNCKYFHQTETWKDVPEGIYMPRGECRRHAPGADGFTKLHAGNFCGDFEAEMAASYKALNIKKKSKKT